MVALYFARGAPAGPCYLLSARQRAVRAWFQLAYYLLMIRAIWFYSAVLGSLPNSLGFIVVFSLGNYHLRAIGGPLLWLMLVHCLLFVLGGLVIALFLGQWLMGVVCTLIFGAAAACFLWQLSLIRT